MYALLSRALPSEHFPELDALSAPFPLQSCRQYTAHTVSKRRQDGNEEGEGGITVVSKEKRERDEEVID